MIKFSIEPGTITIGIKRLQRGKESMRIHLKRNRLWTRCLVLLMAIVISACGSGGGAGGDSANGSGAGLETGSSDSADEPVTLTLLIGNQTAMSGIEAVVKEIEKRFNIVTQFELRPGGSEGDNIVKTRLATGEMADILAYNSGALFKALNPKEYFVDLTDEPFAENIDDSFKEVVSVDGRLYGIPASTASAGGWLYNKKIYEELGLSVPETWDQLIDNLKQVEAAGKIAVAGSFGDTWTSQIVLLADYYNVHSELPEFAEQFTNNKAKFADTSLALRGFEKIAEVYQPSFVNEDIAVATYEDALRMLAEGQVAHYPMLTLALPTLEETFPDRIDDIGYFGQPGDDPNNHGLTLWMPDGFYLNKESEHIEAGLKWMEFFASEEGMSIFMENMTPDGPVMIKGMELPDQVYGAVKEMMPYIQGGKASPALEFLSPLKGPNLEQITVEIGLGMLTPEEGAARYDLDVENHARQLGLEGW